MPPALATPAAELAPIPWEPAPDGCDQVVWRHSGNPVVGAWNVPGGLGIFNSAVVRFGSKFAGIFRVEKKRRFPKLHAGFSDNGLDWQIEPEPIEFATDVEPRPLNEYAYDPRVCLLDGSFYLTWCAGHNGPTIGVAYTSDFQTYHRIENSFLPFNRNGVLFPRKIDGYYWMLSRPSDDGHTPFGDIYISRSPDLVHWGGHQLVMKRGGLDQGVWWQLTKIGAGPTPIETPLGWLILYHGVMDTCKGFEYSMGAAILDLEKPWIVRYRKTDLLLAPEAEYEVTGHVDNVVFPCAALHDEQLGRLAIYYGAADTTTCVAYAELDPLLDSIVNDSIVF
ncbi:Beta-1,4-mannooligosaccharide phosphorylase [Posidoniimonas polymericola]|uniref:Beta-1,4-mannooligosaccharide phosphorylase n=1 Tax=Posidoniimonas polymericola TaxID=2528002 RepID=A0A5C5XSN2_9BACT|nr:glycoside hydrolase family 130 protein [Posidoniimonas polymericola]TWT66237.1 Beta-1,4-mannooligosaccharide phosphorylase [Posidoniimonas polymericola]